MHLSWPDHLQAARVVERSDHENRGTALALMGVALLLLAQDLLAHEQDQANTSLDSMIR